MTKHIEDYALIGDLRTAALVGVDGAIDWMSLPRFDSPAIFAALLGDHEHGRWLLAPAGGLQSPRRRYRSDTLVLESDWATSEGSVRVTDLMVIDAPEPVVIRSVDGVTGSVTMTMELIPRMHYGRVTPQIHRVGSHLVSAAPREAVWLAGETDMHVCNGKVTSSFTVAAGQRITFALTYTAGAPPLLPLEALTAATVETENFWRAWAGDTTYTGPWDTEVKQSLILLKALTYAPSGAFVAAATTSLPERLGGSRNWDYRYSWLRDAAFAVHAFLATGHHGEVAAWRDWLIDTLLADPSAMQIVYTVAGGAELPEQVLDWLPGHRQSAPVRVGNAAARQRQNDVWGVLLEALHAAREAGMPDAPNQAELEDALYRRQIEEHWNARDHGLWEVRGRRRHFVHSKLLAWVGVDRRARALAADAHPSSAEALRQLRATIRLDMMRRGYSTARGAFTQAYGSKQLDAALLLMPRYGFLAPDDPHVVRTVEAIRRELTVQGLVKRYAVSDGMHNVDGVPGTEGTFIATSFWLVDALHAQGRTDEAVSLFQRLLTLRNDVGLLSEEFDPHAGRQLGNTPQGFSHAALVTSAVNLASSVAAVSRAPAARRGPAAPPHAA